MHRGNPPTAKEDIPICVDLDGTLLSSDMMVESLFLLLKKRPATALSMPGWLFRGLAHFKSRLADGVELDAAALPYSAALSDHLRHEHKAGRRLLLVTASDQRIANQVAAHFGFFSEVLASDGKTNLTGRAKAERLTAEFGARGYDYAGDAWRDIPVWASARNAILVNPGLGLQAAVEKVCAVSHVIADRAPAGRVYAKALRLHQWLKNLLVFVPLILAHRVREPALAARAAGAFLSFGLCASGVYLLNDLLDIPDDRRHPTKRLRPLASGQLPIVRAVVMIPLLLAAAFGVGFLLPARYLLALAAYFLITLLYSFRLKQVMVLDVLTLAGLYTIRLLAGSAATGVTLSSWLLAFSVFFFFSLALMKRYSELMDMRRQGQVKAHGRGYHVEDFPVLLSLGLSSGCLSVLVLALYMDSTAAQGLYRSPLYLWLICPLLLYWISRMWLISHRGGMHEDPVVFAATDRRSLWVAAATALLLWLAA